MSRALPLFRLQQIDSQIHHAQVRVSDLDSALKDDDSLNQASDLFNQATTGYTSAEHRQLELERELMTIRIKLEQTESLLYGSKSHTPKELQDLQNEALSLKRHMADLENLLFDAMVSTEEALHNLENARSLLDNRKSEKAQQNASLLAEKTILIKDMQKMETERQALFDSLGAEEVALYENLQKRKQGLAVCAIHDNTCSACGTTLTLALVQAARSSVGPLAHCPSCGRILFGG